MGMLPNSKRKRGEGSMMTFVILTGAILYVASAIISVKISDMEIDYILKGEEDVHNT